MHFLSLNSHDVPPRSPLFWPPELCQHGEERRAAPEAPVIVAVAVKFDVTYHDVSIPVLELGQLRAKRIDNESEQ